jgi:hypothetical protein
MRLARPAKFRASRRGGGLFGRYRLVAHRASPTRREVAPRASWWRGKRRLRSKARSTNCKRKRGRSLSRLRLRSFSCRYRAYGAPSTGPQRQRSVGSPKPAYGAHLSACFTSSFARGGCV